MGNGWLIVARVASQGGRDFYAEPICLAFPCGDPWFKSERDRFGRGNGVRAFRHKGTHRFTSFNAGCVLRPDALIERCAVDNEGGRVRDHSACVCILQRFAYRSGADCADCVSAACSAGGSALPLRSARRRIPAQAFRLKKNRCGTSPVCSVCDNEDATTTLGNSEVLRVQHAVGEPVPEFCQRPDEGAKIPPSVR